MTRPGWCVSVIVTLATLVLNLVQQPRLVTWDTKLDLQFDAAGFIARSLDLWNADSAIGGLQNQASGYLMPMAPAFWLGDVLGVPMWVWERLWSATVMLLAFFGARRLASRWPGIGPWGAVVAGLTYMLAPRVLTEVGVISGETLPAAILPWTVLPLVGYLLGRSTALRAFVLSAATVPWMGGSNATVVLACLIFPGLLLLLAEGRSWRRRLVDVTGWSAGALVACLWWLVPLVLMGGYAPPFLDFIESSRNTAAEVGWLAALRGTSHWVAFLPGGAMGWVGGYTLTSSAVLLVTTVLVAGIGLLGLSVRGLWSRTTLVVAVLVGLTVLTLGNGGGAGSVLAEDWLDALDTTLAPLRNVHKFDPLVRLPLSLGVGAFVTSVVPALLKHLGRSRQHLRWAQVAATAAIVLLVTAAAQPAASGLLRTEGGMTDISGSWRSAVAYLDQRPGPVRVLVLPGAGSAVQSWGRTIDEPIQVLDSPAWVGRAAQNVYPPATLRALDAIEVQINTGRPITGLSSTLRRMGITHVVLRNDLESVRATTTPPAVAMAALRGPTGLVPVADFGETDEGFPEVEVLAVRGIDSDPRVSISDWGARQVVRGGPEAINDLTQVGLISDEAPVVLAGGESGEDGVDIATDTNQRVERTFARITDAVSGVMTAGDDFRLRRPFHDYTGGTVPAATTVAQYDGASEIVASTSGGYANVLGPIHQEMHPYAAFDASPFTAWTTAPLTLPVGQWIEARFPEPIEPGPVSLLFDSANGADVSRVRLTTDTGSVDAAVGTNGTVSGVELPDGATSKVRITVLAVRNGLLQVRLANVAIEGIEIRRSLRIPGEVSADTSMFFRSESSRRACLLPDNRVECSIAWQRETPETAGFARTVDMAEAGRWRLHGRAVATDGRALERLFAPLSEEQVDVEATSYYAGDPAVIGANAFDGREETSWYSAPLDPAPGLQLSWQQPRTIRSVTATLGADQPGKLPEELVVDPMVPGSDPQIVRTSGDGAGVMKPVRTTKLRITALPVGRNVPVGIGELQITGLMDLRYSWDPTAATGVVCGFGPTIEVDGRTVQTKVLGNLSDIVTGAELAVVPCDDAPLGIGAGTQQVRVMNAAGFSVSRLWLKPATDVVPASTPPADRDSLARVVTWSPTDRTVEVKTERDAILSVSESENVGWEARLDGDRLDPVVVDGWRQGWRLPAGSAGEVSLIFTPQQTFQAGIVAGLGLAAFLNVAALVLLVLPGRRRRRDAGIATAPRSGPGAGAFGPNRLVVALGAGALALVSLPLAGGALVGHATRRMGLLPFSALCTACLLVAAVAALVEVGGVVIPPTAANVLTAVVVGLVAGRVIFGDDHADEESA